MSVVIQRCKFSVRLHDSSEPNYQTEEGTGNLLEANECCTRQRN